MITKRIRKILELSFLIAVRQTWQLICNLYNLIREPFLTLNNIIKIKDKSQIFLIAGTAIMPIIGYITARVIWDMYKYGSVLKSVGLIFAVTMIIETVIFLYLGYWTIKVLMKKQIDRE
jgi:hypothetical protein